MFLQEDNKNDPKKIVYLHDIIINKFPFIQKIIDSIGDIDDFIPTLMISKSVFLVGYYYDISIDYNCACRYYESFL